jgi:hypothetical protein
VIKMPPPVEWRVRDLWTAVLHAPWDAEILLESAPVTLESRIWIGDRQSAGPEQISMPARVIRVVLERGSGLYACWSVKDLPLIVNECADRLWRFLQLLPFAKFGYALACCETIRRLCVPASNSAKGMLEAIAQFRGDDDWEDEAYRGSGLAARSADERFGGEIIDPVVDRNWRCAIAAAYRIGRDLLHVRHDEEVGNDGLVALGALIRRLNESPPALESFLAWRDFGSGERWVRTQGPCAWASILRSLEPPTGDTAPYR